MTELAIARGTSAPALHWTFSGVDLSGGSLELDLRWRGGALTATNFAGGQIATSLVMMGEDRDTPITFIVFSFTQAQADALPLGLLTTFDLYLTDPSGRRKIDGGKVRVDGAGGLAMVSPAVQDVAKDRAVLLANDAVATAAAKAAMADGSASAAASSAEAAAEALADMAPIEGTVSVHAAQVAADRASTATSAGQATNAKAAAEAAASLAMAVQGGQSVTYNLRSELLANTTALSGYVIADPVLAYRGSYCRATANDPSSAWVWFSRATVPGLDLRSMIEQWRAGVGQMLGDGAPSVMPVTVDSRGRMIRSLRADGVAQEPVVSVAMGFPEWRAAVGQMLGDGETDISGMIVDSRGRVAYGLRSSGVLAARVEDSVSTADLDYNVDIKRWRDQVGQMLGDGAASVVPLQVDSRGGIVLGATASGRLVVSLETADVTVPSAQAYVDAGALRIVGGAGGDRLLNGDAGLTWRWCQTYADNIQAVLDDGVTRRLVRVSIKSGRFGPDGRVFLIIEVGQSNGEGQTADAARVVRSNPWPDQILMPRTSAGNIWLGQITGGGASVQLLPGTISGLMPAASTIGDSTHGTTPCESLAYSLADRLAADMGYVPQMVALNLSEGGQTAAGMSKAAGAGHYAYANVLTAVQAVNDLVTQAGGSCVVLMLHKQQTESDRDNAALGDMHAQDLADFQADLSAITGQAERMLMLDWQMSSFQGEPIGNAALLAKATEVAASRTYVLVNPSYPHRYSGDWLHKTPEGHDTMAHDAAAAYAECSQGNDRWWHPLSMVSAHVTATNQITVTWSEPIMGVDDHPVIAAYPAIANRGMTVQGRTITGLSISGATMVITTSTPAAGATGVGAAWTPQSSPRTEAAIPRSTIFSAASYGAYPDYVYPTHPDYPLRKAACHQLIPIT